MEYEKRSLYSETFRRLKKNKLAVISMFYIFIIILASIVVPFFVTLEEVNRIGSNLFVPPFQDMTHILGTDYLGRDLLIRLIYGARISLIIAIVSTLISILIGCSIGAVSAYVGGIFESVVMRLLDILYSIPSILLALAIMTLLGANFVTMILAFTLWNIPGYARVMRGGVLEVKGYEYIEAIRVSGGSHFRTLFGHIIPNCIAPIIVRSTLNIGGSIIGIATLSFLGIGVGSNIPEWGKMLSEANKYVNTYQYLTIVPGLAIVSVVLAFNFFGDGLRDALDPKLRS